MEPVSGDVQTHDLAYPATEIARSSVEISQAVVI